MRRMAKGLIPTLAALCAAIASWSAAWAAGGEIPRVRSGGSVSIEADLRNVTRPAIPTTLIGFNVLWYNFQFGYWRDDRVRADLVDYLKPFHGALYRYPGGTEASLFDWRRSIGVRQERTQQRRAYSRESARVDFGTPEFLGFVKGVGGIPLVVANLAVPSTGGVAEAALDARAWLKHIREAEDVPGRRSAGPGEPCASTRGCPVFLWELGNELDHLGDASMNARRYAAVARAAGSELKQEDPRVRLIALTRTAPWSVKPGTESATSFNATVMTELRGLVDGYSWHPYYDGRHVPWMIEYTDNLVNEAKAAGYAASSVKLYVTEHAKWPPKPPVGAWDESWKRTSDLGGAISSADFLIAMASMPNVEGAVWHALGARGPWQLFYVHPSNDRLIPSVVYWGLRVVRAGLLDDAVATTVTSPNVSEYRGGYDVRALVTRAEQPRRISILAVNRAGRDHEALVTLKGLEGARATGEIFSISGPNPQTANDSGDPDRVSLRRQPLSLNFDSGGRTTFVIPANSVTAWVFADR